MTQYALPVIDPNVTTGTDLANYLNSWKPALLSQHAGAARPAYAVGGMLWVETVSASVWNIKLFGGTLDATIGTVNPTTGVFTMGGTTFGALTVTGNTILGDASADTLTVNATPTFLTAVAMSGGDLTVARAAAGADVAVMAWNTNTANANSRARLHARVDGAAAGDPLIQLEINALTNWSIGVDNSDADQFKIGPNALVGTTAALVIHPTTLVCTHLGDLLVQRANVGGIVGNTLANTDNTNGASHARLGVSAGGASGGDAFLYMDISGVVAWHIGIDNSDADKLKIGTGGTLGAGTALTIDTALNATFAGNVAAGNYTIGDGSTAAAGTFGFITGNGAAVVTWGNTASGLGGLQMQTGNTERLTIDLSGRIRASGLPVATGFTNTGDLTMAASNAIKSRSTFSAWVRFNSSGAITRALNVTSVTKNSTGNFTINIAAGVMADASYGYVLGPCTVTGPGGGAMYHDTTAAAPTATTFTVQTVIISSVASAADPLGTVFVGFLP